MADRHRILTIFGTRPEGIKMGPVIEALRADSSFEVITLASAQHRDMLDEVLDIFEIVPDHDLDVMTRDQQLVDVTSKCLHGIDAVMKSERPDLALVQGDTTTVMAAALAAYYNRIPLGHVEAGLRTRDKFAPFPEEINRRVAGTLADLHFAPTTLARDNLLREGVASESVHVTGNTVIDAVISISRKPAPRTPAIEQVEAFAAGVRRFILVTAHRRESFGAPFEDICRAIHEIVEAHPDTGIVFPVHPNPNVQEPVNRILGNHDRIQLVSPLNYVEFVHVMKMSTLILSDSGGVQEEAPSLDKPVLVLRNKTERPEGIEAGVARLVGTDRDRIIKETGRLLESEDEYNRMVRGENPYGDGNAGKRIVEIIDRFLEAR